MTEQEWLASAKPHDMLWHLRLVRVGVGGRRRGTEEGGPSLISDRKLRLFACACCRHRQVWLALDQRSRDAVLMGEQVADGAVEDVARAEAFAYATEATHEAMRGSIGEAGRAQAAQVCVMRRELLHKHIGVWEDFDKVVPPAEQAVLLREIVGNPFQPVRLMPEEPPDVFASLNVLEKELERKPPAAYIPRAVLTPTVVSLARAAHEERPGQKCPDCNGAGWDQSGCKVCQATPGEEGEVRHGKGCFMLSEDGGGSELADPCSSCHKGRIDDGTLAADRLAVLSDALEDAGCDNADLLTHLRSPGPHVRGCWVVDLILGKE